jgi:hypothetical protein
MVGQLVFEAGEILRQPKNALPGRRTGRVRFASVHSSPCRGTGHRDSRQVLEDARGRSNSRQPVTCRMVAIAAYEITLQGPDAGLRKICGAAGFGWPRQHSAWRSSRGTPRRRRHQVSLDSWLQALRFSRCRRNVRAAAAEALRRWGRVSLFALYSIPSGCRRASAAGAACAEISLERCNRRQLLMAQASWSPGGGRRVRTQSYCGLQQQGPPSFI